MYKLGQDFSEHKTSNHKVKAGELDSDIVNFCFLNDIVKKNPQYVWLTKS